MGKALTPANPRGVASSALLLVLLVLLFWAALSAGPAPPTANPGLPQLVSIGSTVHLDGAQSTSPSGAPLTFQWSFVSVPAGSSAAFANAAAVHSNFVADKAGSYLIQLSVSDGSNTSSATVLISTQLVPPIAGAGPNEPVNVGSVVRLDGSRSTDASGNSLSYQWTFISTPAGSAATLSNPGGVTPTFVVDLAGDYVIQLAVNDGHGNTSTSTVIVSTQSIPPIANAGPNQTLANGSLAQLDGSKSSAPNSDSLTYFWVLISQPVGSTASLNNANGVNPTFTLDVAGTYVAQLTVADSNTGLTAIDTVEITTDNLPPQANAGAAQNIASGSTVHLDGSKSSDPNGHALTYSWTLLSKPAGSNTYLKNTTSSSPSLALDQPGPYVVQLIVSDTLFTSAPSTVLVVGTAAAISINPTSVNFPSQALNTTSNSQSVTITNSGTADLSIFSIGLSGFNNAEFAVSTPALPLSIGAGASVNFTVTFTPGGLGQRSATLKISDNTSAGLHSIALSGIGGPAASGPTFTVSPNSNGGPVNFGSQAVNSTSAPTTFTVTNSGGSTLSITNLQSSNPAEFKISPGFSGTINIPPTGTNTFSFTVTFTPSIAGTRTATISVADNASGSPHTIQLTGNGTAAAAGFSISPNSAAGPVNFGSQPVGTSTAPTTFTITNTGNAALTINSIQSSNSGEFAITPAFPGSVNVQPTAGSNSLSFNVIFTPSANGTRSATITIADSASGSPHTVQLTGTGTAAAPGFSITPNSSAGPVDFGSQALNTSSTAKVFTITNTGNSSLNISSVTSSSTEFAATLSGPSQVAGGATTAVSVVFTPSGTGLRSATLTIADNTSAALHKISLSGTGAVAYIGLSSTSIAFGNQAVNTTSSQQVLTVSNTGSGNLVITAISIAGTNASDFGASPSSPAISINSPLVVAGGTSTNISLTFTPAGTGSRTAALKITDNATNNGGSPHSVTLSGTGTGAAPSFGISPNSSAAPVNFGSQAVNTTGAATVFTITNTGNAPLTVTNIQSSNSSEFALTQGFGGQINIPAAGSGTNTYTFGVTFSPSAGGTRTATVTITDNASGSPHSVQLTGNGTAPAPGFAISPNSSGGAVNFGSQPTGTGSTPITFTITNTGNAPLTINSIQSSNSAEFAINPAVSTPVVVQATTGSNTFNFSTVFTPTLKGTRSATLNITHNAAGGSQSVQLTGTGTAAAPGFSITPNSSSAPVDFGSQAVNTTSSPMIFTVTNNGNAPLNLNSVSSSSAEFAAALTGQNPVPAGGTTTISVTLKPSGTGLRTGVLNISDNTSTGLHKVSLSGTGVVPFISISPTSLNFNLQQVNTTSAQLPLTISNSGNGDLLITGLTMTGANPGDFATVPAGASVSAANPIIVHPNSNTAVNVVLSPSATGSRSATLNVADNASGSPHLVSLFGTGSAPVFTISPNSAPVDFGFQAVNATSAAKTFTITNTGNAPLTINSIQSSNPVEFALSQAFSGQVVIPAAGSGTNTFSFGVTFTPGGEGTRNATLTIGDNATGNPHSLSLAGTGAAPLFSIAPNSAAGAVDFGNQSVNTTSVAKAFTITNTGNAPLTITGLQSSNSPEFAITTSFSGSVTVPPTGANTYSFSVTFTPPAVGSRSASVTITDNASGSPHTVQLTGTGTGPIFNISPNSASTPVDFGNQAVSTASSPKTFTITNTGNAPLTINSIQSTNPAEFTINPPIAGSVSVSATPGSNTFSFTVIFAPGGTGTRTGAITITDSAGGSPHTVQLIGAGQVPGINFSPSGLTFGNQMVNSASAPVTLTITNTGVANLVITGLSISGANPGDFSSVPAPASVSQASPIVVAPNASTTITVTFTAQATGNRTANLILANNAPSSPQLVLMTGTGVFPNVNLSPASITFTNSQLVGTSSNPITLSINNTGNGPLTVSNISINGANPGDFSFSPAFNPNSPLVIPANSSANLSMTFNPTAAGQRTATLSLTDNAAGSPHTASLTGTATSNGTITMPPVTLGANLEVLATASLDNAPSSNLQVKVTSSDPGKVLVSSDTSGTVSGFVFITLTVPAGQTILPGFYIQALAPSGTVQLTVTAPGYTSAVTTVTLTPSGFVLTSPTGQGQDFSTSVLSADTALTVSAQRLDNALNVVPGPAPRVRGGLTVSVPIKSADTSKGTILGSSCSPAPFPCAVILGGSNSGSVNFHPVSQGTTLVSIDFADISTNVPTAPFSTPVTSTQLNANVTAPQMTVNPATVGVNLQARGAGVLQAPAPNGGVTLTISVQNGDPRVLLSSDNTGTTAGSSSINLPISAGATAIPTFWIQGVSPTGASPVTLTISSTPPVYTSTTTSVAVTPSGFVLTTAANPINTTTISLHTPITLTVYRLDPANNPVAPGIIRGGLSVTIPIATSDKTIGSVDDSPANLAAGGSSTPATGASALFFHAVGQGTVTVFVDPTTVTTSPSGSPFSVLAGNAGQLTAVVSQPAITLNAASTTVGYNLQIQANGALTANAPSSLTVTISSPNGNLVLLSTSPSSAGSLRADGTSQISINLSQGQGGGGIGFPPFFVQAMAASGTVTLTATAPGYAPGTLTVNLAPSGFVIHSPNGIGQDFATSLAQGAKNLTIESWQLDSSTLQRVAPQGLRGGASVGVPVSSSSTAVGSLSPASVLFSAGAGVVNVTFTPASVGTTQLALTEPPGFATPTDTGVTSDIQINANVSQ
ncbi:MAG TPA: choice-of-anchor D domain-containing protein [Terriglobales bacterium]|nr:choice-of-anchor D domain-containing protein [Terriglobales bacterium]